MINPYILVLIGIAVGALTGITGSSGVLIVVPALSYLGLTFQESIGSSLLVDVITTISVVVVYFRYGNVDLKLATLLAVGAIIGAQTGAHIAFIVPEKALEIAFVFFTSYMAYISFKRSKNPRLQLRSIKVGEGVAKVLAILLAFVIGNVTGTLGASGGIMFIAVMMLLFPFMDIKRMIGSATLAMLFSATSGSIAYIVAGKADVIASLIIGLIALISGYFFAKIANMMKSSQIYMFLGSVFVLTSISEIIRVL
ncbi:MAG: sulfite exporter TauE/SafE family protein [Sulfolobus sp.]